MNINSLFVNEVTLTMSDRNETPSPSQVGFIRKFLKSTTTYIYWFIGLKYLHPGKRIDFSFDVTLYSPDGSIFHQEKMDAFVEYYWKESFHHSNIGWEKQGRWNTGTYKVEVKYGGACIARGTFEIYMPESEVLALLAQLQNAINSHSSSYQQWIYEQKIYDEVSRLRRNAIDRETESRLLGEMQNHTRRSDDLWVVQNRDEDKVRELSSQIFSLDVQTRELAVRIDDVLNSRGYVVKGSERDKSARTLVKWFINKSEKNVQAYTDMISYLIAQATLDDAITVSRHAVRQYPDNKTLREQLCRLLEESQRSDYTDELIALLKEDLSKSPLNLQLKQKIFQLLNRVRKGEEALSFLNQELAAHPDDVELRKYLIKIYTDNRNIDQVLKLLREQLQLTPGQMDIQIRIAELLSSTQKIDEAVRFLEEEIGKTGTDPKLREYLNEFLLELLRKNDQATRRNVVRILQEREGMRAFGPLSELFLKLSGKFDEADDCLYVLQTLVKINPKGVQRFLAIALTDVSPKLRLYGAQMIGRLGSSADVKQLAHRYVFEDDEETRKEIFNALRRLDRKPRSLGEKILMQRRWAK